MRRIGVSIGVGKDPDFTHALALTQFLSDRGCIVLLDAERIPRDISLPQTVVRTDADGIYDCDILFVLGGDGSILATAKRAALKDVPVLAINLGRIGYMAELEIDEFALIDRVLSGAYETDSRMMLDVALCRGGEEFVRCGPALNDVVVANGPIAHMANIELSCADRPVSSYTANGLILSTPTGSTAYSMSAGGPIIDPTLDCICVTPICAHSLTSRPVVFSAQSALSVSGCRDEDDFYLTVDGRDSFRLQAGDVVRIWRSSYKTKLIRVKNSGFLGVLRRKMSV